MKKICCIKSNKFRKFKNSKISYILKKKNLFIEILKIIGLINDINE